MINTADRKSIYLMQRENDDYATNENIYGSDFELGYHWTPDPNLAKTFKTRRLMKKYHKKAVQVDVMTRI